MGTLISFYKFTDIHHGDIQSQLESAALQVIRSGNYVMNTQSFEEEFADYVGSRYCVALSTGTAALHLAMLALGIRAGDEIITVAHTFRATAAAARYIGAHVRYIDIDPDTYVMDPRCLEAAINERTRAIVPVHIYGNAADMTEINTIAQRHNLAVIEDCSQAHGTRIGGQHVGTFGAIGTFSFYPGKSLGALGDAGCLITDDQALADEARYLRSWGDREIGYNYRLANMQAEFLRIKLRDFPRVLREKRNIAAQYDRFFGYAKTRPGVEHSYHVYPVLARDRADLIAQCRDRLELRCHYPVPVHRLPAYREAVDLPITEHVARHQVSLPMYPGVDAQQVIKVLNDNPGAFL